VRELAPRLRKSRNTIRRALRDAGPWEYRVRRPRPRPVMDSLVPVVERWLDEDRARPRKQRAHRPADLPAAEGACGSLGAMDPAG
jgi:hypothetical protein